MRTQPLYLTRIVQCDDPQPCDYAGCAQPLRGPAIIEAAFGGLYCDRLCAVSEADRLRALDSLVPFEDTADE